MTRAITTVAATVGTSLQTNLRAIGRARSFEEWVESQPENDRPFLSECRGDIRSAETAARNGRWVDVGTVLARVAGIPRVLGAELSSLLSLAKGGKFANLGSYHLIHSDSPEGEGCAEAVRAYLQERVGGAWCQLHRVPDLFHGDEARFRIKGLRALATVLAEVLRSTGERHMVIDATGGYKAQIAVAVVFGQAFKVPVVYRFEAFRHVVELPVLPLTLDLSLVGEHLDLLAEDSISEEALRERFGAPLTEANASFAAFRAFLDEAVPIDGADHYPVSAFGQIMLDRWRLEGGETPSLPAAPEQGATLWGDHHRPKGVEDWVDRLMERCPWVVRVIPGKAAGRTHVNGIFFRLLGDAGSNVPDIECRYVVDNHPAVLRIQTTASSRRLQEAALRMLERKFR